MKPHPPFSLTLVHHHPDGGEISKITTMVMSHREFTEGKFADIWLDEMVRALDLSETYLDNPPK